MPQGAPLTLLNPLLNIFLVSFAQGSARLQGDALWLIGIFFGMELLISGMFFALRREVHWGEIVQKAIMASILSWAVPNWQTVTNAIARGFMSAGVKTAGGALMLDDLFNPDAVINLGFQVSAMLLSGVREASAWSVKAHVMATIEGGVGVVIIVLYFIAALALFVTLLEYYLGAAFTIILLPWAMLSKTAWLAERALSHLFAGAVRLGFLAVIVGLAIPTLLRANINTNAISANLFNGVLQLLVALTLIFLIVVAHLIARAITSGSPALAVADMVRTAQSTQRTLHMVTTALERVADTLSRLDPSHSSRQPTSNRRRL